MALGLAPLGSSALAAGAYRAPQVVVEPVPIITGMTVTPVNAQLHGGDQLQFLVDLVGENNPPLGVTWSTTLGDIDASGLLKAPSWKLVDQTGQVTATSTFDPAWSASATFIVMAGVAEPEPELDPNDGPGPTPRTVRLTLGEANGPAANLDNLMVSFHAASGPHATGMALYQSATETTDDNGMLSFELNGEMVIKGQIGLLSVLALDGRHYLGLVAVE